jgi:hypothetical protein
MFLVPLHSSDIATPDGTGFVFKNKVDFVSNFRAGSFSCERILALIATKMGARAEACRLCTTYYEKFRASEEI